MIIGTLNIPGLELERKTYKFQTGFILINDTILDTTNFDKNLDSSVDTIQKLADAVDELTLSNTSVYQIGDGINTSLTVTHNKNKRDLNATIRRTASPYNQVYAYVEFTTLDTITVKFTAVPTMNEFTIIITG